MENDITIRLSEIKEKTGWSETRLASEIGASQPTVNRILNGQKDCKISTWLAIDSLHKQIIDLPGHPMRRATDDACA